MKLMEAVALGVIDAIHGVNSVGNTSRKRAVVGGGAQVSEVVVDVPVRAVKDELEVVEGPEAAGAWRVKVKVVVTRKE